MQQDTNKPNRRKIALALVIIAIMAVFVLLTFISILIAWLWFVVAWGILIALCLGDYHRKKGIKK